MSRQFDKPYNPKETEDKIYKLWEKSGFFNPDNLPVAKIRNSKFEIRNFSIIMPPPNANGALHFGHALFVTIEDLMIRYKRMLGYKTLWLPGADHAGFETQVVFDKKLEKEGRNRFEIPRDELYKEIWDFTQKNKKIMENQLRKLGASCDWSREKFTLDPDIIEVVYDTFKKLYEDGLVYRDLRVINWCTKHQTALSDLEVKWGGETDKLYYVKYKIIGEDNHILVATTRPETIHGDTAVAVNPRDKRYKNFIGKKTKEPITENVIPIIADEAVDMDFGTGALKITPGHDATDREIGKRHKLSPFTIIDDRGYILSISTKHNPLTGLKIKEARQKAVDLLKERGLLEKEDEYKHQVATCYKCGATLEPLLKPQWFINMTGKPMGGGLSLRDAAVKSVKSGQIKFVTKKFEKVFFHWMKNIRDWNISRQIIWGIPIPAWYCGTCGKWLITTDAKNPPQKCTTPNCSEKTFVLAGDVFDTWFSSGQWPFAVLMANRKNDFKEFYPTDVMETGWDILFFWVARMIMLGIYRTGKVPFHTIYLHGLVRDKDRQKMSKSKGNVIDPLGVAEIYGADAVRMALITSAAAGNDPVISEEKIRGYRNFATKVWNISRFVMMNHDPKLEKAEPRFTAGDKKNLAELKKVRQKITKEIDNYKFHGAALAIYHYIWHTFADKIIEESKPRLKSENAADRAAAFRVNMEILTASLKMLHPFMPFLTEEIYQNLPIKNKNLLMTEKW